MFFTRSTCRHSHTFDCIFSKRAVPFCSSGVSRVVLHVLFKVFVSGGREEVPESSSTLWPSRALPQLLKLDLTSLYCFLTFLVLCFLRAVSVEQKSDDPLILLSHKRKQAVFVILFFCFAEGLRAAATGFAFAAPDKHNSS